MARKGNATCILLDVGPAMSRPADDGGPSNLEKAVKAIGMMVREKIFFRPKDEVALVLFGCEETENELHDNGMPGLEHIMVHSGLQLPGLDLVRYLNNSIIPSVEEDNEACFLAGMAVAVNTLSETSKGKKLAEKELIMFSDVHMPFWELNQLDQLVSLLADNEVSFKVVGVEPDDDDDDDDEDDEDGEEGGGGAADEEGGEAGSPTKKKAPKAIVRPEVPQDQDRNPEKATEILNYICKMVPGSAAYEFSAAIEVLSRFSTATVNPTTTFRGPLEIGPLQIGVECFNRLQKAKPVSFTKVSPDAEPTEDDPDAGKVRTERVYKLDDDDGTEVDKEELIKAYRYGNEYIPMDDTFRDAAKVEGDKDFKVLEFVPAAELPRHLFVGKKLTSVTHTRQDPHAATALSALCHALFELELVIIAKQVYRKNADPKLWVLWPHIKVDYEALLGAPFAFRQDVRSLSLPSLAREKKHEPTEAQLAVMDKFIDSMDLMTAHVDEDGDPYEALQPKHMFNPVRQRTLNCIEHRATNPGEPLPSLDPLLAKHAYGGRAELLAKAADQIAELEKAFPLKAVGKGASAGDKHERSWADQSKDTEQEAQKRRRVDEEEDAPGGGGMSMSSLLKPTVLEVGAVTPVADFEALCEDTSEGQLTTASQQLQARIDDALAMHMGGAVPELFATGLLAMRKHCVKGQQVAIFNDYLVGLRAKLTADLSTKQPFWDTLVQHTVAPISSADVASSTVSPDEAVEFLKIESDSAPLAASQDAAADSDEDDLMDDL